MTDKDSLVDVLKASLVKHGLTLKDGDVVCVVSKVVSLCEGGLVRIADAPHGARKRYGKYQDSDMLSEYIESQADIIFPGDLAIRNGMFTPSAGVDTSNVPPGYAIAWPRDAYGSAHKLRDALCEKPPLKKLGVLIFDSGIMPLRNGVTGISLGYAGFRGLEDYRGKRDLFGNLLRVTQRNIADGLAAAATLVTGEGAESIPFVLIREAPVHFTNTAVDPCEVKRPPEECLYSVLYPEKLLRKKS